MAGAENQSGAGNGQRDMESFRRRLNTLEGKLAEAKGAPPQPVDTEARGKAMGQAFKLGIEMVASVAVGVLIGWSLDHLFGTKPIFLLVFLFLGAVSGIMNVIRTAKMMQGEPMPGHHLRASRAKDETSGKNEE
ncbi:MAG: AtpZ/AtpI family protein [Pseudomonadota bacterium]